MTDHVCARLTEKKRLLVLRQCRAYQCGHRKMQIGGVIRPTPASPLCESWKNECASIRISKIATKFIVVFRIIIIITVYFCYHTNSINLYNNWNIVCKLLVERINFQIHIRQIFSTFFPVTKVIYGMNIKVNITTY